MYSHDALGPATAHVHQELAKQPWFRECARYRGSMERPFRLLLQGIRRVHLREFRPSMRDLLQKSS
jgi:hypothetical protein